MGNGLWPALLAAASQGAAAEPVVIHDSGHARPLAEFVAAPAIAAVPGCAVRPDRIQAPRPRFPIRTPGLGPGPVAARTVSLPQLAGGPIFLVGSDSYSREWLARYRDRLRAAGAAGIVVQADTTEDFAALQALAQDLALTAFDATELVRQLGLTGYPALVSAQRIEQ